jgi:hypothetical protein
MQREKSPATQIPPIEFTMLSPVHVVDPEVSSELFLLMGKYWPGLLVLKQILLAVSTVQAPVAPTQPNVVNFFVIESYLATSLLERTKKEKIT